MNIKKILPWICFGVSLLFFILGWVFPQASRWLYLPALLGYAGCTAMLGLGEWEKSHKIMAIVWWVIALMAAVLGIVQAAVSTLVFSFNPLFFIIVLLLSIILGWEEKPKEPKAEEKERECEVL
jgi:hypothetical protein